MNDYLRFLERVTPAVVTIHALVPDGHPSVSVLGAERTGTGLIVDEEMHVLTVGYIVLGADRLSVTLHDGRRVPAAQVGRDFDSGLAVIRIEAKHLPYFEVEEGVALEVGQKTHIVASTGAEKRMATSGFITSLGLFDAPWEYMLEEAIFTTAINPGVGGGPLLNYAGSVLGVVSLNLGGIFGMTLAVPSHYFCQVREELYRHGRVVSRPPRPWMGIYSQPLAEPGKRGVVVAGLVSGGPAHRGGMQEGDLILAVDGVEVDGRQVLYETIWRHGVGEAMRFTIQRGTEAVALKVVGEDRASFYG